MTALPYGGNAGTREVVVLGLAPSGNSGRLVRHIAVGRWTLCGVELSGTTVPDPPELEAIDCEHFLCERFRAEVRG
jgi:hypothetical protein